MHIIRTLMIAGVMLYCCPGINPCFAQYQNLQFKKLTPDDGLTQGVIRSVFRDSRGFVWLTGLDGINRFDGLRCLANREIAPGLSGVAETTGIIEDKNGDIWIGYEEGLILYSYSKNRFDTFQISRTFKKMIGSRKGIFVPVAMDTENNIVINLGGELAFIFNPAKQTITELPMPIKDPFFYSHIFTLRPVDDIFHGLYRMVHLKDSIQVFRLNGVDQQGPVWKKVASIYWKGFYIVSLAVLDENTIVFSTHFQLFKYHIQTGLIEKFDKPDMLQPLLAVDIRKNIWVGTNYNGVFVLDGQSMKEIAHFTQEKGRFNNIAAQGAVPYCDSKGNIWLMEFGIGVEYGNLTDIKFNSALSPAQQAGTAFSSNIRDIQEDERGNFYCSVSGNGIIKLDSNLQYMETLPGMPAKLNSPDMYLSGKQLFIGSDLFSERALLIYNTESHALKKINHAEARMHMTDHVYQFSPMPDGNLLAATYAGLWKLNARTGRIESMPGITDTTLNIVFSYVDRHGQIYKGIKNEGLSVYRVQAGTCTKVFDLGKRITLKHCAEINDTLLWLATTDGLYRFNSRTLRVEKRYSDLDGLANNVVYALMPDEKENLWMSTNKGLSYLNVSSGQFRNFTKDDGLQSNEFNTHAVVKTRDGRIIFGGVNGLTTVNPEMLKKKTVMPVAQLTSIITDSSQNPFAYSGKNKLRLAAGINAIEFEITALDFINPAECKTQYRLLGYEDKWRVAGNPANIRYIKLSPGHYELQYRVSNTEGEWSDELKSFPFSIAAYWWQTRAFRIGLVLAVLLIGFWLIRLYTRGKLNRQKNLLEKYQAVQQERERIITDLHDDVGATLSSMHIYGDLAENVWESQPGKSKEMVGKMTRQSKDLMNRMRDIVWSLKSAAEEKNSFSPRLRNYSQELLSGKDIAVTFDIDENLAAGIINPLARKNLLLIAKEAMNNTAKYSRATRAEIALKQEADTLVLTISDNGMGFGEEKQMQGNGLGNIRQRCEQLQGKCSIDTGPGQGVKVSCRVPIAIISHWG